MLLKYRVPAAGLVSAPETTVVGQKSVAGKPWTAVMRVVRPTMTVYTPVGRNTGAVASTIRQETARCSPWT